MVVEIISPDKEIFSGLLADDLDTYSAGFVGLPAYKHEANLHFFLRGTPIFAKN